MVDQSPQQPPAQKAKAAAAARKEARLKQALKANMGRRKAQARARDQGLEARDTTGTARTAQSKDS